MKPSTFFARQVLPGLILPLLFGRTRRVFGKPLRPKLEGTVA
jgi:hypothetical protein